MGGATLGAILLGLTSVLPTKVTPSSIANRGARIHCVEPHPVSAGALRDQFDIFSVPNWRGIGCQEFRAIRSEDRDR